MTFTPIDPEEIKKDLLGSTLAEFNRVHLRDGRGRFTAMGSIYDSKARGAADVIEDKVGENSFSDNLRENPRKTAVAVGAGTLVATALVRRSIYLGRLTKGVAANHSFVAGHPGFEGHYDIGAAQQADMADMQGKMAGVYGDIITNAAEALTDKNFRQAGRELKGFKGMRKIPRGDVKNGEFTGTNFPGRAMNARTAKADDALSGSVWDPKIVNKLHGKNAQESLRNVEKFIKNSQTENSFLIDSSTNKILSGTKGHKVFTQFWLPTEYNIKGQTIIMTHNHPHIAHDQIRGFSPGDMNVLRMLVKEGASKQSTFRAIYPDGTAEEIVITDWRKFDRFVGSMNQVAQAKMVKLVGKENITELMLKAQADIQKYASESGKYGFKIVEHTDFAKRLMSDTEIKHRKKLQAGIAVTTSTLGLTALGLKGGSVAAGRVARSAAKANHAIPGGATKYGPAAMKAKKYKKLSRSLDHAAVNTSLTAGGIGGVGGYNFASYTRAEGKKKQIVKNWEPGMDFGLGTVHQGEEISKWSMPKGFKLPGDPAKMTVKSNVVHPKALTPVTPKTGLSTKAKIGIGVGATAGVGGTGVVIHEKKKQTAGVAKRDWRNIEEHKRGAADARRRKRGAQNVAGTAAAVGGAAALHGNYQGKNMAAEVVGAYRLAQHGARNLGHAAVARDSFDRKVHLGQVKWAAGNFKRVPHGTATLAGYGTAAGALAVGAGFQHKANKHNRAIAAQRKKRAVVKAYDPERNRQRRLTGYQNATMFGAGATAVGAAHQLHRAAPGLKKFATTKYGKGSLKSLGAGAALGVGAAGLAVGSQRINSYKKGRGRSYSPLRTIGY